MPSEPSALGVHWRTTDEPGRLPADALQVWRCGLDQSPRGAIAKLDAPEQERLARVVHPDARRRFLASRYCLRIVLGHYLGVDAAELRFVTRTGGKPALADPPSDLQFNLTHTGDLALLAVARQPVGIDAERLRPVPHALAIARRVLPGDQADALKALEEPERSRQFFRLWTRFEAAQKAQGAGVFGERSQAGAAGILEFNASPGHVAAVAWLPPEPAPTPAFYEFAPDS